MNIALGAIVLAILIYPGILFRFAYVSGPYSSRNFASSLIDELLFSLIPALFFQLFAFFSATCIFNQEVRLDVIYKLIVGPFSGASQSGNAIRSLGSGDFSLIQNNVGWFTVYMIVVSAMAVFLGLKFRKLSEDCFWYEDNPIFKFNNEWWEIFSGRILGKEIYKEEIRKKEKEFFITVTALTNTAEGCYLYYGKLEEYYFLNNDLDRICLSEVYRRPLKEDRKKSTEDSEKKIPDLDDRYYYLPGSIFVLKYADIVNLDIQFNFLEELTAKSPSLANLQE